MTEDDSLRSRNSEILCRQAFSQLLGSCGECVGQELQMLHRRNPVLNS